MRVMRYGRKKSMDTATDPYLNKVCQRDNTTCGKCGALYHNKRWSLSTKEVPLGQKTRTIGGFCPACQKIRDGFARGFVTLEGNFLKAHSEEIKHLIHNKEKRVIFHNPLERIIAIRESKGRMEVTTTTEKFAQRLGAMLKKAYKGELEYKWSDGVKLARVRWRRDS